MQLVIFILLFATASIPALAQNAPQASVVQQVITNDATIKAALAEQLDKANAQIAALKAENEALKKAPTRPEVKDKNDRH